MSKIRKKTMTVAALAFMALATSSATFAQSGKEIDASGRDEPRGGRALFEQADADSSGDVSFDEFAEAMNERITGADANGDGKMTVGEVADAIQRMRAERQARRIIARFDENGDGELTMDEIRSRQQKRFALYDQNNDGKLTTEELPRREGRRGGRDRRN